MPIAEHNAVAIPETAICAEAEAGVSSAHAGISAIKHPSAAVIEVPTMYAKVWRRTRQRPVAGVGCA
eukprot:984911-Lingulodinium_polyedra.AAC.1